MVEHTLARAFHQRVAPQTVLIRRLSKNADGGTVTCQGSGVIITHGVPTEDSAVHILTAGHVLDGFEDKDAQWFIQRNEIDENGNFSERAQSFKGSELKVEGSPGILCTKYLRECDIALIVIENKAAGGGKLIDSSKHKRLKVVPKDGHLHPGARVAWCGMPAYVAELLNNYPLCYFEGVVACVSENPPLYLVDGHAAEGVSGGPMWMLQDDGEPVILGVCISFHSAGTIPSGLIGFCPLQALLRYIAELQAGKSE